MVLTDVEIVLADVVTALTDVVVILVMRRVIDTSPKEPNMI